MKRKAIKLFLILLSAAAVNAQDDGLMIDKEIYTNDHRIILVYNSSEFFTGSIQITDRYNNTVFFRDNFYSGFISDTLIDLDKNGADELILNLSSGINAYDFNMLLIFDFSKSSQPLYEIHNAEITSGADSMPKIISNVRFSPLFLGTGYNYSLIYDGRKMELDKETGEGSVLSNLDIKEDDMLYNINEFKKEMEECEETSNYISFFEQYLMQKTILNKADEGLSFFDKYYECRDKDTARAQLKSNINTMYEYLSAMNHRYSGE